MTRLLTDWGIPEGQGASPVLGLTHKPTKQVWAAPLPEASDKQIAFMRSLAKQLSELNPTKHGECPAKLEADLAKGCPKARASKLIDRLLELKDEALRFAATQPKPSAKPSAPVTGLDLTGLQGGHYAVRLDGAVRFFEVSVVREGKWAGWVFVSAEASDDRHRQGSQRPGSGYRGKSQEALQAILADEQAAFALYGHELGKCGVCGRTLTDEESRARGIGPICAEKVGF